jgi:hypothetical protein
MNRAPIRIPSQRARPRLGCLGSLLGFALLGTVAYLLILAVFAPWGYFLGGNFHLTPMWQGWGKLHAKSGDFVLFVSMYPSSPGRVLGYPSVTGSASLCTPRGERFSLNLTGGFDHKQIGLNTDHQSIDFHMYYWPLLFGSFTTERRPRFDLHGYWLNPDLVMEDRGTLASAFLPDGRAYLGPEHNQPPVGDNLQITLAPGSQSEFAAACQITR